MLFNPKRGLFFSPQNDQGAGVGADPANPEPTPPDEGQETESEETPNEEEPFDQARAMDTIKKQRENERKLAKELKAVSAALKTYQDKDKAAEDANKSELEKLTERASQLEKDLQTAQNIAQGLRLQRAFARVAGELKLNFTSAQASEDAFDLADMSNVEIDADGKVTGLEDALKALQKSRPYLFSDGGQPEAPGTPPRNAKRQVPTIPQTNQQAARSTPLVKGF